MNPEDFENDSAVDLEASEFDTTGKLNTFLQKSKITVNAARKQATDQIHIGVRISRIVS